MKRNLPVDFISLIFVLVVSAASFAEAENFGLYKRVGDDSTNTYWELQWSTYIPSVENEEPIQGDIPIELSGGVTGGCDPNLLPSDELCNRTVDFHEYGSKRDAFYRENDEDPKEFPPITVSGSAGAGRSYMLAFIPAKALTGSVGLGFPIGYGIGRIVVPDAVDPCDEGSFDSTIDNFLDEMQKQVLTEFLNSQAAQDLWTSSNFFEGIFETRREQVGFLLPPGPFPGGSFQLAGNLDSTPCNAAFDHPGPLPEGTILVHTHPWSAGEPQFVCGGPAAYHNEPGPGDADALQALGLTDGAVMDADGIVVFDVDGNWQFVDEKCGYDR